MLNKSQIKVAIVIIIIGVLYLGAFYIFFKDDKTKVNNNSTSSDKLNLDKNKSSSKKSDDNNLTLIFNPNIKVSYDGKNFKNATNKVFANNKFDLYENNNLMGNYYVTFNDKLYFYDEDRNFYNPTGDITAISGNINYEIKEITKADLSLEDFNIKNKVLSEKNITSKASFNFNKYIADIDNDNVLEKIYTLDNAFLEDIYGESNAYAYVFVYDDDKINYIYEYRDKIDEVLKMCSPNIRNIIDIDKNNVNEIFISCSYYSHIGSCMEIYQIKNNKYKKVLNCNI